MRNIFTALLFFISVSLFSQDEKRLALVIGNANYDKGELKNPVNDARLIASTLDSLEFDVILKENLSTKREMLSAVKEFGSKRSEYDVAFVYYAGHGVQVDDENFLLPTKEVFEEEFDVMDYGVSVQNIMRYLRAQTNEVNILILDACRDNPFESNWNTTRSLKGGGLAKIPPPTGSLIAFSTDSGQTAPDGDGDNSVYTISLAKNMLLEDTSIDQVFRNVRAEVLAETDGIQRPVEATQLTGQTFYLNPKSIDRFLSKTEGEFNSGDYEMVIFSVSENRDLFMNINFLKILINSYEILGRNDDAEIILDEILEKENSDELLLEYVFNYYDARKNSKKAGEIIDKIYVLNNSKINEIRKNYYDWINSDFESFDELTQDEYESKEIQDILKILMQNHDELIKITESGGENSKVLKYIFKISRTLLYAENRMSESEIIYYVLSAIKSLNRLIEINSQNPINYLEYANFLNYNLDSELKNKPEFKKAINYNIFLIDDNNTQVFEDNLVRYSYELNKGQHDEIIKAYFRYATRKEPKANYHLSNFEAEKLIDELNEKKPNNLKLLDLRAEFFADNKKYEFSIKDYKKIITLLDNSETYKIIEVANYLHSIYENLGDNKNAREILQKYVEITKINEAKIESFDNNELYLYGEVFQTIGTYLFVENEFIKSKKYIDKSKAIWKNNNSAFEGKTMNDLFLTENSWKEYQIKYGSWNTINYAVNMYGYYTGGNLVESYINWISLNYKESLKNHRDALIYSGGIGERAEYDYMNLILLENDEESTKLYIDYINNPIRSNETENRLQNLKIQKFVYESKSFLNTEQQIKIFIDDPVNRKMFNEINELDNQENFYANPHCLEILNLLYKRKMFQNANSLVDEILNKNEIDKIESLEFLYKSAKIKHLVGKKFEAYSILNYAKKLLDSRGGLSVAESHKIGYLSYGLVLNFDGINLIKYEDLNNLEELIVK